MLGFLWQAAKGNRLRPWRSRYLLWRIETYWGWHAGKITPRQFRAFFGSIGGSCGGSCAGRRECTGNRFIPDGSFLTKPHYRIDLCGATRWNQTRRGRGRSPHQAQRVSNVVKHVLPARKGCGGALRLAACS